MRLLSAQPCSSSIGYFEDLTIHPGPTSPSSSPHGLRVLSDLREFDMAVTDSDGSWTLSPDLQSLNHHLRVVSSMDHMETVMGECDVILDSGADTSALPLCCADVGIAGPAPDTCFVDAQGTPLNVQATRVANIRFGDVTFRERFIVSDITCPLLSLGSVLRSGWNVMHIDGMPFLTKDDKRIEVLFKNNSLCARGQISVLTERDMPDMQPAVRVVQLGMVLRCLVPGWNRINPHLFAIKTTSPKHVDTTLCPSDELMWLRTTLVFREVGGWEVVELCEPIADMRQNLEEEIYDAGSIVEVITLAHKYAMQDEQLGFFMYDRSVANPANFQVDAAESDGYEPSVAPDPQPDEVPVDKLEGEPLEEDRVVPFADDSETVIVDGIAMTMECTLKILKAGCNSLGLSGRGGKAKCLKRMAEHIKAQSLLAAHGAEVRLKSETERTPIAQSKPEEPTAQELENHALTHEPFKAWCPFVCPVQSKAGPTSNAFS